MDKPSDFTRVASCRSTARLTESFANTGLKKMLNILESKTYLIGGITCNYFLSVKHPE